MIPIQILPAEVQTQLVHDQFILVSRTRNSINIPSQSIIVKQTNPDYYVTTIQNTLDISGSILPFYLQHVDLFREAQDVFEQLFGVEADVIIIYAYKTDYTQSSFLFSNKSYINNVVSENRHICFKPRKKSDHILNKIKSIIASENKHQRKIENIINPSDEIEFHLPSGIFPVIGFYNNLLSHERKPSFNLIFGSTYSEIFRELNVSLQSNHADKDRKDQDHIDSHSGEWISNIGEDIKNKFKGGIPLYCIGNFGLTNADLLPNANPLDMSAFYQQAKMKCVDEFILVIVNLLLSYARGSLLPTSSIQFISCMAHFYKVDRTEQSVKKTISLQEKLRKLYDTAGYYASNKNSLSFKDFIAFFIQESIIDFDKFSEKPGDELKKALVNKRTMLSLYGDDQILSSFLNGANSNQDYSDFLQNQVDARNAILPYIP